MIDSPPQAHARVSRPPKFRRVCGPIKTLYLTLLDPCSSNYQKPTTNPFIAVTNESSHAIKSRDYLDRVLLQRSHTHKVQRTVSSSIPLKTPHLHHPRLTLKRTDNAICTSPLKGQNSLEAKGKSFRFTRIAGKSQSVNQ